ncbi:ATP-binding protein [Colwellia piezophila]|uniref:ATP-binding protein n=1 Tax=Colwellia piezophila TaxID=211668 RepID=UPI00037A87AC|nr:ATP-binding protein [Colwellia piezophila]
MNSNDPTSLPSTELFQSVLDTLPFCVFWKDFNSVGLGCNQALADIAGLDSPKDYIGKTDYDLPWTEEEADFFRECDRRVMDSGKAEVNIIESQKQANGRIAWLETSKIPLTDKNGNIIGILGAFHDITERKRIEDENIAIQKLDSLGTLAAGLAHDFNNILAMILASSQMAKMKIASSTEESNIIKYLDNIENATKRASVLTEKFMNYSERGQVTKVVCNLSSMIEESIAFVQPSIKASIRYEANNLEDFLYADVNQIHQVLNNLLINASQASTDNEKIIVAVNKCKIKASGTLGLSSGNYFAVSIKDNGVGISEDQKEDIFKPYFTTKDKGHGLGLSSCQTIVKNHNGSIQVESKVGSGSTFTIYLPISPPHKDVAHIPHPFSTELIRGSGRILYIEDDLGTQASIVEMLQELGYEVQSYSDVKSAINYIKGHPDNFDVVITDFIIGDFLQGGTEILDNVRFIRPNCPVILLTGYFKNLEKRAKHDHEFSYIAQKPIGFAKISQIINSYFK